jgi:hypothetical protein
MPPTPDRLRTVLAALGYRPLSRIWAKMEIFLGLGTLLAGLLLSIASTVKEPLEVPALLCGSALFVLGGYLTLAGHRSHLYQSSNERLVLLIEEIRTLQQKDKPS